MVLTAERQRCFTRAGRLRSRVIPVALDPVRGMQMRMPPDRMDENWGTIQSAGYHGIGKLVLCDRVPSCALECMISRRSWLAAAWAAIGGNGLSSGLITGVAARSAPIVISHARSLLAKSPG
jgi:hypothetical protein